MMFTATLAPGVGVVAGWSASVCIHASCCHFIRLDIEYVCAHRARYRTMSVGDDNHKASKSAIDNAISPNRYDHFIGAVYIAIPVIEFNVVTLRILFY